jgi:hypothetical protein
LAFINHLSGFVDFVTFLSEIVAILSLLIFGYAISIIHRIGERRYYLVLFAIFITIIASYPLSLYVRSRYLFFLFFLIQVVIGWGLHDLNKKFKNIGYFVCFSFLAVGILGLNLFFISNNKLLNLMSNQIYNFGQDQPESGVFHKNGLYLFAMRVRNPETFNNVAILNINNPDAFDRQLHFDDDILQLDIINKDIDREKLDYFFSKKRYHSYLFMKADYSNPNYIDPYLPVLDYLQDNCENVQTDRLANISVYKLTHCFD